MSDATIPEDPVCQHGRPGRPHAAGVRGQYKHMFPSLAQSIDNVPAQMKQYKIIESDDLTHVSINLFVRKQVECLGPLSID